MDGTSMQVYWCSQRVKMFASWDWPSIVWWHWALAYPLPMEERFRPAGRPVRWPAPAKAASPAVAAAVAAVALRCRNDWRRESSSNGSESCCWRSIGIRTRNSRKWLWVWWACCVRTTDARRTQDGRKTPEAGRDWSNPALDWQYLYAKLRIRVEEEQHGVT